VGSLDRFGGVGATGALRSNIAPYRPLQGTLAGQDRFGHGHDFDHGFGRRGFYPYGLFGFGGLGWGWGYPWWGGYASVPWWYYGGYGDYGDYGDFADYGYPADAYNAVYPNLIVASGVDSTSTADASAAPADTASSTPAETASSTPIDTASASEYYSQALDAFHAGNYANALRFAGHAAIDNPRDPNVHLLLSLSLFALGNYPGAAAEAHAVAAGGVKVDWTSLIGFYNNDASAYTSQLRALESYITKNPSSMAARFLLGFHYLAEGYKDAAQKELLAVVNTVPQDRISADLLVQAGGHVPENVAQKLKENAAHAQGKAPGPAPAPAPNTTR
jgi:tetratricopeptide (TPR) repeat protein